MILMNNLVGNPVVDFFSDIDMLIMKIRKSEKVLSNNVRESLLINRKSNFGPCPVCNRRDSAILLKGKSSYLARLKRDRGKGPVDDDKDVLDCWALYIIDCDNDSVPWRPIDYL